MVEEEERTVCKTECKENVTKIEYTSFEEQQAESLLPLDQKKTEMEIAYVFEVMSCGKTYIKKRQPVARDSEPAVNSAYIFEVMNCGKTYIKKRQQDARIPKSPVKRNPKSAVKLSPKFRVKLSHKSPVKHRSHRCPICNNKFKNLTARDNHMKSCKIFLLCDFSGCEETFDAYSRLKGHIKIKHADEYICDICKKIFYEKDQLHLHLGSHRELSGLEKLNCPYNNCEAFYYIKGELTRHIRGQHEGKFQCTYQGCSFNMTSKFALLVHMKTHTKHTSSLEDSEHSVLKRKRKRHVLKIKKEIQERKNECEKCGFSFRTKSELRRHKFVVHENRKAFPCPYENCPKVYYRQDNLYHHKINFHEGDYECTHQGCSTVKLSTMSRLTRHMKSHHLPSSKDDTQPHHLSSPALKNDKPHHLSSSSSKNAKIHNLSSSSSLKDDKLHDPSSSNDSHHFSSSSSKDDKHNFSSKKDDKLHNCSSLKDDKPHNLSYSKDDKPHHHSSSNNDKAHHLSSSKDDESHHFSSSKDDEPHHLSKDDESHHLSSSKNNEQHHLSFSKDDEPHHFSSSKDDEPHHFSSSKDDEPHHFSSSKDDEHHLSSLKDDEPHHLSSSKDDEPHHLSSSKDNEPHHFSSSKDDEPHHFSSSKDDEHHLSSLKDDEPHHLSSSKDDEPHHLSSSKDNEPHHLSSSKDDEPHHFSSSKDDEHHLSSSKDDEPHHFSSSKDDEPHHLSSSKDRHDSPGSWSTSKLATSTTTTTTTTTSSKDDEPHHLSSSFLKDDKAHHFSSSKDDEPPHHLSSSSSNDDKPQHLSSSDDGKPYHPSSSKDYKYLSSSSSKDDKPLKRTRRDKTCAECSKVFVSKRDLERHMVSHKKLSEREIFSCVYDNCAKFYYYERNLDSHMKLKHEGGTVFHCIYKSCNRKLTSQAMLDYHLKCHGSEKSIPSFQVQGGDIGRSREREFICDTCKKVFTFKRKLRLHLVTHEDVLARKVLPCPNCKRMFSSSDSLKQHTKFVHLRKKETGGIQNSKESAAPKATRKKSTSKEENAENTPASSVTTLQDHSQVNTDVDTRSEICTALPNTVPEETEAGRLLKENSVEIERSFAALTITSPENKGKRRRRKEDTETSPESIDTVKKIKYLKILNGNSPVLSPNKLQDRKCKRKYRRKSFGLSSSPLNIIGEKVNKKAKNRRKNKEMSFKRSKQKSGVNIDIRPSFLSSPFHPSKDKEERPLLSSIENTPALSLVEEQHQLFEPLLKDTSSVPMSTEGQDCEERNKRLRKDVETPPLPLRIGREEEKGRRRRCYQNGVEICVLSNSVQDNSDTSRHGLNVQVMQETNETEISVSVCSDRDLSQHGNEERTSADLGIEFPAAKEHDESVNENRNSPEQSFEIDIRSWLQIMKRIMELIIPSVNQ